MLPGQGINKCINGTLERCKPFVNIQGTRLVGTCMLRDKFQFGETYDRMTKIIKSAMIY